MAKFLSRFLETFFEDTKTDKLHGNIIFFQLVLGNKNYAQMNSKQGQQKNLQKFEIFIFEFFFPYIIYLSI